VKLEAGWEWNIWNKARFHLAFWTQDTDNLPANMLWQNKTHDMELASHQSNRFQNLHGFEWRLDRDWGMFRARLSYHVSRMEWGITEPPLAYEHRQTNLDYMRAWKKQEQEYRLEPRKDFRGTFGFYAPERWGFPLWGTRPVSNTMLNFVHSWRNTGRLLFEDNPGELDDVWVSRVNRSNTDMRLEKRLQFGRARVGVFMQVFNLFNQKYLIGPDGNQGIEDEYQAAYREQFNPDKDRWGEYKPERFRNTLPWFWDALMFNDKRDVFYGLTLSWQ
jgi:hypothetical protein